MWILKSKINRNLNVIKNSSRLKIVKFNFKNDEIASKIRMHKSYEEENSFQKIDIQISTLCISDLF